MEKSSPICIIEDNLSIRNLLSLLFKRKGFQIYDFENGLSALSWLENNVPSVIICDIMLPDISGSDILSKVRSMVHTSGVPVIVVTGFANINDREKYLQQGFNGYIAKPINVTTFVQEVEACVAMTSL